VFRAASLSTPEHNEGLELMLGTFGSSTAALKRAGSIWTREWCLPIFPTRRGRGRSCFTLRPSATAIMI
jgi:hypothetical protein